MIASDMLAIKPAVARRICSRMFGDIFDMFFGQQRAGGAAGRANGPQRGSDLRYDIEITLEEAFAGTQREISFRHLASCATCKGSGAEPGTLVVPCDRCGATGIARQVRQTPLGQFDYANDLRQVRNGDGQVVQQPCRRGAAVAGASNRDDADGEDSASASMMTAAIRPQRQRRKWPGNGPDGDSLRAFSVRS